MNTNSSPRLQNSDKQVENIEGNDVHQKDDSSSSAIYRFTWAVVGISIAALLVILGTKFFYGYIVPEARTAISLGTLTILSFAFIAGVAAFFAPCPFAVFPAYIAYFLQSDNRKNEGGVEKSTVLHAFRIGLIVSLGIFSFYLILGIIMMIFGIAIASYANWLKLGVIPLFFIGGVILVSGKNIEVKALSAISEKLSYKARGGKHFVSMYLYGVIYGVAAAACHLPILIVIALVPILKGDLIIGLSTFIAYAFGTSLVLISLTILAGKHKNILIKNLGLHGNRVKKIAGIIFILTGIYLISFYVLFKM